MVLPNLGDRLAFVESWARRWQASAKKQITLPTLDGGGLMPGVDIDNSAALLDIMEADGDWHA